MNRPLLATRFVDCWQIYGWDDSGTIELGDIFCNNNTATEYGGCLYTFGRGLVTDGTVMHGNLAYEGGCICELHRCIGVCRNLKVKLIIL